MEVEEFLRDVCPNHTDKSKWNKSELLHILESYKEHVGQHTHSKDEVRNIVLEIENEAVVGLRGEQRWSMQDRLGAIRDKWGLRY